VSHKVISPEPKERQIMANAPATGGDSDLLQTELECMDCDKVFDVEDTSDCPNDPEHATQGIHVSAKALGYDDDRDHYHHGRKRYEYPAATA
jgi:hypothetical protein